MLWILSYSINGLKNLVENFVWQNLDLNKLWLLKIFFESSQWKTRI